MANRELRPAHLPPRGWPPPPPKPVERDVLDLAGLWRAATFNGRPVRAGEGVDFVMRIEQVWPDHITGIFFSFDGSILHNFWATIGGRLEIYRIIHPGTPDECCTLMYGRLQANHLEISWQIEGTDGLKFVGF